MKPQALCAWLGKTDIRASKWDAEVGRGPILQALDEGGYAALTLLSNYSEEESTGYRRWLAQQLPGLELELRLITLSSPTDFAEIYEAAVEMLGEFTSAHPDYELTFHLSPGTPAMAATWILIASGKYTAYLVETSREKGVQKIRLPFEILAEYHPRYGRRIDSQIIGISDEMLPVTPEFDRIIHDSEVMTRTVNMSRRISFFDVPVLLLGESGTGKELFARAIHGSSQRADGPFVSVNCGALPEGLVESELFGYEKGAFTGASAEKKGYLESADGGTLFLDEIGELPLHVQVLLLRVLQDGSFQRIGSTKRRTSDFRLISATNRPLLEAAPFRDDLFHRIAVGVIKLPPLRERENDLQRLTDHFLQKLNDEFSSVEGFRRKSLSVEARKLIGSYSWPGNVRELINTLTRACLWCAGDTIDGEVIEQSLVRRELGGAGAAATEDSEARAAEDERRAILDRPLGDGFDLEELVEEVKRHYLRRAMEEADGSKVEATRLLGLSNYQTLSNWLDRYGVEYSDE